MSILQRALKPFLKPLSEIPPAPVKASKGDISELIFAVHRVCGLMAGGGVCVCGELTGPSHLPESHPLPTCPIATVYRAVDALAVNR